MNQRVRLPPQYATIRRAVDELQAAHPKRKFTPDGHLMGSIGEVVAAEALGLKLHPSSHRGHDAYDADGGDVQIKITAGKKVAMYEECIRLVVLLIISLDEAEIIYDGPGQPVWAGRARPGKNGQCVVSIAKLKALALSAKRDEIP